jgi:hypothetical protein
MKERKKMRDENVMKYDIEKKSENIMWLFTHFLYVINEKLFKFDFGY